MRVWIGSTWLLAYAKPNPGASKEMVCQHQTVTRLFLVEKGYLSQAVLSSTHAVITERSFFQSGE